ncbi:hypothetical protein GGQ72_004054 [Rhizobium rhizoryzae]|uniref:Uncharacterized protein n=1 Tax=Rhizobium rhizoryzae TaxID=451876 RepID=A0A7W6LJG2_9HYPH|nr:hypothetical protein [Rhizobium rhizoryzae]
MQNEIFQMNQFTIDPQRGTGIEEMKPFKKAFPDGRFPEAFVKSHQRSISGY